ncbi:MAG: N-acetylmuramic acid 6-phosphate etherase [Chloroflexi bacterium]|nr:N-acetylmuramic acid 6-phosphate etherase [Chloroflexota bacterium]
MSPEPARSHVVIGIDGGGSKVHAVVMDAQGRVLGRGRGGPSNPHQLGWDAMVREVARAVQDAARAAEVDPHEARAIALAQGGIDRPEDRARALTRLQALWPRVPIRVENDALAALVAGVGTLHGIVLIAGTGSIAYGVRDGRHARAGGWGHWLDVGSGFVLGMDGLRAVLAAADDMGLPTSMTEPLLQALGLREPGDILTWLYDQTNPVTPVAQLAPLVLDAAAQGDPEAMRIALRGAEGLADAVHVVAQRLDFTAEQSFPIVFAGGLLRHHELYRQLVQQAIHTRLPKARIRHVQRDYAEGAAWLAWDFIGHPLPAWGTDVPPNTATNEDEQVWTSEQPNVLSRAMDTWPPFAFAGLMNAEDERAVWAVRRILPQLARAIEAVAKRMAQGGRLIYVGAGTSGRLGVLDAAECPPTFRTEPGQVVGVLAGGWQALGQAREAAEDDPDAGARAMAELKVGPKDTVVGLSASGRTPYVLGAIREARRRGAYTLAVVCNLPSPIADEADHTLAALVGPEVLTGSTRLKAGTAQKLILNTLSTGVMVQLGKVYGNLMVDVRPDNTKLRARAIRILRQATGVDEAAARAALEASGWDVKVALVSLLAGVSPELARQALARAQGHVHRALQIAQEHPTSSPEPTTPSGGKSS